MGDRRTSTEGVVVLASAAAALLVLGVALLALAKVTPWHSSEEFYPAYKALEAGSVSDLHAYQALEDRYRTNKWLYADLGYLSASLSVLLAIAALTRARIDSVLQSVHAHWRLVVAYVLACTAFWTGETVSILQDVGRNLIPVCCDSAYAGALALAPITGPVLSLLLAPLFLWPLLRGRTVAKPLAYARKDIPLRSLVWTLIYGPLGLALITLAILTVPDSGSWAVSPALAGLGWLALNARVLAIAPRPAPPPQVLSGSG
jgi:hypothetical protein